VNWEQSKRAAEEYAKLLFEIAQRSFRIPLVDRDRFLDLWSFQAAERMILQRLHDTARTWRQASREVMRGRDIYRMLQSELAGPVGDRVRELVAENALLIKTLPENVALMASKEQARRAMEGQRPAEEQSLFQHIARWQARRIARTETAKAQSALTRARSEELDLSWYVWRTSKDERVRLSHRKMEGILVNWEDAPSPEELVGVRSALGYYHAGNAPNCRCYNEPLLRTEQVSWPRKCYVNGRVEYATLAAFRRMNQAEIAA
jgi:SPP1 gp7 family putative phage head morphogenesis protein